MGTLILELIEVMKRRELTGIPVLDCSISDVQDLSRMALGCELDVLNDELAA